MKRTVLAAAIILFPAGLYAQQAKLTEVEIKENYGAPVVASTPAAVNAEPAKETAPTGGGFSVGKKHLVADGDTLWGLSSKYYKDPFKWGKIYNANIGMVQNPDRIYPRQELVIPDITEEVKPEIKKEPEITGADTVKEADFYSADVAQQKEVPVIVPAAVSAKPSFVKAARAELSESLKDAERSDLSEEMPEHQKEWSDRAKIVPALWHEDGVITAKEKGKDNFTDESLSIEGESIVVSMERPDMVKPGDYLTVYLKSGVAFDKAGKKLGREVQYAGMAAVVSVDGSIVKARVIDAVTGIFKGYIVKKK